MPADPELSSREIRVQMIWRAVSTIPPGRVATYGDVARAAGLPGLARFVGYALRQLSEDTRLPWHRVINGSGRISLPESSEAYREQAERLRQEGVPLTDGRINLRKYRHDFAQPGPATTGDAASAKSAAKSRGRRPGP